MSGAERARKARRAKFSASIPEDLYLLFREHAIRKFGTPKKAYGAISRAAEEAIRLWLEREGVL